MSMSPKFRHRDLDDAGPFTLGAADAWATKVREGGRGMKTVVMIATEVNADVHEELVTQKDLTRKQPL